MMALEQALLAAGGKDALARLAYADWLEEQRRPGWESSWWRYPWVPPITGDGLGPMGHSGNNRDVNTGDGCSYGYRRGRKLRRTYRYGSGDGYGYGFGDGAGYGGGYGGNAEGGSDGVLPAWEVGRGWLIQRLDE